MNHIKEVVKILSKKRIDKIELLDNDLLSQENSLFAKLYSALKSDEIKTDEDAIHLIYGKNNTTNNQKYRILKSRLYKRIQNTLYFIDQNADKAPNNFQRINFQQRKIVQTINILRRNGATEAPIRLIKDNFKVAEKYNLYDICKFYAYELSIHYALRSKLREFETYRLKYEEFKQKESAIQNATLVYYEIQLTLHHSNQKVKKKKTFEIIDLLLQQLEQFKNEAYSFDTQYFYLRAMLFKYEYDSSTNDILNICDQITELTTQKDFKQPVWQGVAALYRAKALLSLKKYDLGLENISKDIHLFVEGGQNWFTAMEFKFILALHSGELELAEYILYQATRHKDFKSMPDYLTQKWYIFEAYLLLCEDEKLNDVKHKRLKIAKLMNETPYYVNDKSGYFLAIRFLEMIELLRTFEYSDYSDKCLIVKIYKKKFLKEEKNNREKIFIDMLLNVHPEKKSKSAIQKINQKAYLQLKENKEEVLINDYEILPYDKLWDIILKYLD